MTALNRRDLLHAVVALTGAATACFVTGDSPADAAPVPVGPRTPGRIGANGAVFVQPPVALNVGQDRHSAFPGLTTAPDGRLWLVWREGSHHVTGRDGDIVEAWSTDHGLTYHDVRVLRRGGPAGDGVDYRDPSVSWFDQPRLTWFTGTATQPAGGAYTMTAWSPSVRIDRLPYAAMCAPLVRLPNGQIGAAFYGRQPGESIDTSFMAWSADEGRTWSTNRIVNAVGAGIHHNEPVLLVDGTQVHYFARWGTNDGIGMRTAYNSGLGSGSANWSPWRKILDNATGRPSVTLTATGRIVMVYRERGTGHARLAFTADRGATWLDGGVLAWSMGGLGCAYAAMVPRPDGTVYGVVAMEDGGSSRSRLFRFLLTVP